MEEWRDIPNIESYEASNAGRIRNKITNNVRQGVINKNGYRTTNISINNKPRNMSVHKLVCLAFKEIPKGMIDPTVNHIDEDKLNNKIENLEWLSRTDNIHHSRKSKGYEAMPKVIECYKGGNLLKVYKNYKELEADGFRKTNVSDIIHSKRKTAHTHKGFSFIGVW